ncbi:MAG: hypothetical protein ACE5EJ_01240 [Nitrosopumilaceae archaeon]
MEPISGILSSIAIANIVILLVLMGIFGRAYLHTKAKFMLSMVAFSGLLLLHNVIGAEAYFVSEQLFAHELVPYLIGIHSTELVGLLVFLKISLQ